MEAMRIEEFRKDEINQLAFPTRTDGSSYEIRNLNKDQQNVLIYITEN